MKYVILNDAACDKRIKKLGAEVAYFSKEKLDKMYPPNAADTYSVVGYTALDKADDGRNRNQEFTVTVGEGETSTIPHLVWGYTRRMNNSTERSVSGGNL